VGHKQPQLRAKKLVKVATASGLLIIFCLLCIRAKTARAISSPTFISLKTTVTSSPSANSSSASQSSTWDTSSFINLAGVIVQALAFIAVIKYVRDTAKMASATREAADATKKSAEAAENTVQEMKAAREEERAPFVVVYFNYIHSRYHSLYLVVENIGKSIARDIKFEFTPPLQVSQFNRDRIEKNMLLKKGIKSLVPNYKIPIPFDYLMHYIHANLPMEYTVKVTYWGNPSLPPIELEYPLDLNHFNYIHFVTETGLSEIDETLQRLVENFSHYSTSADTTNNLLNHIANSINRGLIIKNRISVSRSNTDTPTMLKEFVFLWVVDYGKQTEKWNRPYIFGMRAKCLLFSEELLKSAVTLDSPAWIEQLKQVISNLSRLGSMQINLDLPDGSFSSAPIFLSVGSSKEDFDNLGDSIITDIRTVIELIEKEKETSLNGDNEEAATQSIVEEAD